jgi:antagonist of KipI
MRGLRVVKPGLHTTVQDLGRWGWQRWGVAVAGPMDPWSHRVANRLVGNDERAATLEITVLGPELEFPEAGTIAVAGAEFGLAVGGAAVPCGEAVSLAGGSVLRFGARRRGARAYLAVAGGLATPLVFGSRATHVPSRMGGLEGRPLAAGDWIPFGDVAARPPRRSAPAPSLVLPEGGARVRVMPGPHEDVFTDVAHERLRSGRFVLTPESNRMGYRLDGPALERRPDAEIVSDATTLGALQVPASGQPILLMADRQTAGGYPRIATLITADLPLAGQLAPGDWISFEVCDCRAAVRALIEQERSLLNW